jgi:azurin
MQTYRIRPAIVLSFAIALLAGCIGSEANPPEPQHASPAAVHAGETTASGRALSERTPAPAEAAAPAVDPTRKDAVVIRPVGDQLEFDTAEFTARAGQTLTIIFENTATSEAMSHNVVVLTTGADINRLGAAAMAAGEAMDYVPDDPAVVAATPLAAPGETVEVTFTVPDQPGAYPFVCTFAGHYVMMQGIMQVTS